MDAASKAGAERESAKNSAHHHEPEHTSDGKHPRAQSFLALTALGVVFGDIGTSPLYTFSTALNATGAAPGATQVLGVVSLTFWALMVLISLKYVTIVLRADNDGEGGILALLSLVEHHGQTAERVKLSIVVALGVIGAALLYGDGVITPAISVLSAIEGSEVQSGGRELCRAGDARHPGRTFCASISWHRQRRPPVRAGDGGLVRRHRCPWRHQYLVRAADLGGIESAGRGAFCKRKSADAFRRPGRRIPGFDRRRGALR